MHEQTRCVKCGQSVLVATADKFGGRCRNCASEAKEARGEIKSEIMKTLLGAAGMVAIGIAGYYWFGHLEADGGRIRTHVLVILAYNFLGKAGVFWLFMLLAALFCGSAYLQFRKLNDLPD